MRISIGGDISIKELCCELFANQATETLFGDVLDVFAVCDRNLVNLECAVTDKDTPIKKFGPNLNAPLGTIDTLKKAGVTDCALSNNHIFDFGIPGLNDTVAELEKNGLSYTGVGKDSLDARKNLIIEGNKKIAVIAVCEHEYTYALPDRCGAREYDPYDTMDDIMAAKKEADYVVVIYHGGKEYCRYPSPRLLKLCRSMVHHGADVVLCQHSHCIGCYEEYMGAHILYGQGNFHFMYGDRDKPENEIWNTGLLTVLDFGEKCSIEFIPTVAVVPEKGIRLAKGKLKERLLRELDERSKTIADGTWKDGWHAFCETVGWYRSVVAEGQGDRFGHFLDCEAHTDVLRELYPTWNQTNEKNG